MSERDVNKDLQLLCDLWNNGYHDYIRNRDSQETIDEIEKFRVQTNGDWGKGSDFERTVTCNTWTGRSSYKSSIIYGHVEIDGIPRKYTRVRDIVYIWKSHLPSNDFPDINDQMYRFLVGIVNLSDNQLREYTWKDYYVEDGRIVNPNNGARGTIKYPNPFYDDCDPMLIWIDWSLKDHRGNECGWLKPYYMETSSDQLKVYHKTKNPWDDYEKKSTDDKPGNFLVNNSISKMLKKMNYVKSN